MFQCFVNQNAHVYIKQSTWKFSLIKVMKIPTQKGEHSCKCTELSLKRKEGIGFCALLTHVFNLHNLYIT